MEVTYITDDGCEYVYFTSWEKEDLSCLIEEAAQHYYFSNDGWEAEWPLNIGILIDGKSIGIYEVGMEDVPTFSVNKRIDIEDSQV